MIFKNIFFLDVQAEMARIMANPVEKSTLVSKFWALIPFLSTMNQDSLKKYVIPSLGQEKHKVSQGDLMPKS